MNLVHATPLQVCLEELRTALARTRDQDWMDSVHGALADVAAAVQEQVRAAEDELANVGVINPDFRAAPIADRHVEWKRENLIKLGEMVHQLRGEIQKATSASADFPLLRQCGQKIADAIEEIQKRDDEFLLKTLNSNPGAGD